MTNEELAARIKQGETTLILELWTQCERFVRFMANKLICRIPPSAGVEFDDLVNSGFIALVSAINYYDPSVGALFTTVLGMTLKSAFAEASGLRTKRQRLDPLRQLSTLSLDAPLKSDDAESGVLGDVIPDARDDYEAVNEQLYNEHLRLILETALSQLPRELAMAVREHYLLEKTVRTGQQESRLRDEGLRRLRAPGLRQPLDEYRQEMAAACYCRVGVERFKCTLTSSVEVAAQRRDKIKVHAPISADKA